MSDVVFSSKNMSPYYLAVSQIYGSYLLCLYFEFFDDYIGPNQEEIAAVVELRKHLLQIFRWPEMVTFEEMNVPAPEGQSYQNYFIIRTLYAVIMENEGFSGGVKLLLSSGE